MRSQASKPSQKKGELSKTSVKAKQTRKKSVSPKKIKQLVTLTKTNKKNSKDDKTDGAATSGDKKETIVENVKTSPTKVSSVQNECPPRKSKKDPKEKKEAVKSPSDSKLKRVAVKKTVKKVIPKPSANESEDSNVKYKINKKVAKKPSPKFSKAKTMVKKGKGVGSNQKKNIMQQSKPDSKTKPESGSDEKCDSEELKPNNQNLKKDKKVLVEEEIKDTNIGDDMGSDTTTNTPLARTPPKTPPTNQPETPKSETERPPKFFTSSRSPRMVDIDVKCLKNSKGNLSVSERFLSLKCETKTEENNKDKSSQNTLVSQGPEIDVYTFTEKVDSPKNILSDFRNPINKNIGRVRPIARVKGTVIDKKSDSEKKKYSPHRPIEEVVKQLKVKRSEELRASQEGDTTCSLDLDKDNKEKDSEDTPKPIVSKSYKMVARKSSVTGKPFSPIKFLDNEVAPSGHDKSANKPSTPSKKQQNKNKKPNKSSSSDDELDSSKFSLNTTKFNYSSSEESVQESNDDNDDTKESSESESSKNKKPKNKKYKKITDSAKKTTSKELKELSKDSLVDIKDEILIVGNDKPSKRRRKLLSMWNGPKKHRMASLNAIAKVHCLYENESRTHMELGLMKTVDRQPIPSTSKPPVSTKKKETKSKETEKPESTSESEYETQKDKKDDSSESSDDSRPQRPLRGVSGVRSAGKYWDPKSSTSSSEDSEHDTRKKVPGKKKISKLSSGKISKSSSDSDKPPPKLKKTAGVPVKKKRNRNEVVMDLKDMVVQKRMASLNATAILAASYEKRSPASKSSKDETTSDSCSDESFSQKSKNGVASGVKSEIKSEEPKQEKDCEEASTPDRKEKVEVIVNQDTDVTITGVYSTHHHEGFCTVSGLQYRISSTSHTQTTATANCEKEGCSREDGSRYTPLTALSSMQPPAEHAHNHPHPVPELGGLSRRAGCSSAFSAPSPSAHHDPGYYQPAGPLIKESSNEDRALARYHPPHYHAPHPPVLQQYGPPYYPDLCYGRYYRPPGPYHMPPPQPDAPMGGIAGEPYPPPQYYGTPPCYQHSPQRIPYVEYRGCPCPLNACPKNVLIGPVTGKAPASGGPDVPSALAPPGGTFRAKVRTCALDNVADTHGSGKDPPLEPEPPAATDAPHPCPLPAIGGASPKREMFDVRDNLRIASEVGGSSEAIGPPSPARGSAGVCAPQPPTSVPRRARLGKAMARRSLAGDDTGLLLSVPQSAPTHSDADDDVLAISPPISAPIDLSSSDERSPPLVDIKKENEGPTFASARKPEAQALKEHNSTAVATNDATLVSDTNKPVKRRYSRPKLEIDMKDTQLEEGCKTNGIGEHVKLVKRRKVSGEHTEPPRIETATKEPKKKPSQAKRIPKSPKTPLQTEKKTVKRKLENTSNSPRAKKILVESQSAENPKVNDTVPILNGVPTVKDKEEVSISKPKIKSALVLDNLIRKNSIDRTEEKELNPAELFLSPVENIPNSGKKVLNINNNIVENTNTNNGVRPKTIAAVSQLIGKKLAYKNSCKLDKGETKVTHNQKSVLKLSTVKTGIKDDKKTSNKSESTEIKTFTNGATDNDILKLPIIDKEDLKDKLKGQDVNETLEQEPAPRILKPKLKADLFYITENIIKESQKTIEPERKECDIERTETEKRTCDSKAKRCKLTNGEIKAKNVEKVVKLLVSKRPAIKTDEATLVVEEACASPVPMLGSRRARKRGGRRGRRLLAPAELPTLEPRAPPRWSNGWNWDGEHYLSKVYLNNDSRLDRMARCWSRMTHASGDKVAKGDCVLLRASVARAQPFVARVASLWENPEDGEMMVSLVWYYRPEHTDRGRQPDDAPDEVFASRHRDANSVACIEDKCYVLTFNEYCRYRKRLKAAEEGVIIRPTIVPPLAPSEMNPLFAPNDSKLPPSVSPELVLFCRKIYDFRSKKIHVPNK